MVSSWHERIPWPVVLVLCATIGLAPFTPQPHVWEKLTMLFTGTLTKPVDIFDLLMHGGPWLLLAVKLGAVAVGSRSSGPPDEDS